MAEKQTQEQNTMQRGGHEGSETNVQNAENVDGSAQAARFDSLRISNYATGIDDVRWMPSSSTEQETSSEQQQPAQGYLTDVARIAPSSTANDDIDQIRQRYHQNNEANMESFTSGLTGLDNLDRQITRMMEEMNAQREKIKNLEAQVQQERAEKDQLQMQNAQLKSYLQRALVMKDSIREGIIRTMNSKTIELRDEFQKTYDEMEQTLTSETTELHTEMQKVRDELQKVRDETKEMVTSKTIELRDEFQKTYDEMEQIVTTDLRGELQKMRKKMEAKHNKPKNEYRQAKGYQVKRLQEQMSSCGKPQKGLQQQLACVREQVQDLRMPMLREYTSGGYLHQAVISTENNPHMMPVDYFIKAIRRCSPVFIRLFGYPSCNPVFWFSVLPDLSVDIITIWTNPLKKIAKHQFKLALQQFNECYEMVPEKIYVYLPSNLREKFIELFKELTNNTYKWTWGTRHLFYMKEEQQKIVSEKWLGLPSEYRFDDIHPTSDARFFGGNDETHMEIMRKRFECLPTVAVRSGDVLKGVGAFGMFGFYILRGETLAQEVKSVLEMRVWQESIRKNFSPLQRVNVNDKDELKRFNESILWTRLEDRDHNPIAMNVLF